MLEQAKDVPMLGMFGDENWTPNLDHPGLFKRAGINHWATYKWDPDGRRRRTGSRATSCEASEISFDEVLCGSPFGAPGALLIVIDRAGGVGPAAARTSHDRPGRPVTCSRSCSS